jgi:hypothetical protein
MYNQVDPSDSRWVYNTQEFGRHARFDQKLRVRKNIAPLRPQGEPMLRFNWVAPLRMSPHDPKTLYAGAQVLFRSRDRGDHWEEISPDLTTNDPAKISPAGAAIQFCTITTISESVAAPGVIWAGTDDGKVQVTRNAGQTWFDATSAIAHAGGPEDAWVTRVFASNFSAGTAYVAKSRLRQDDFRPFLYKTTDFGATWVSISGVSVSGASISSGLPARTINVIVEDSRNPALLFVGNDIGVYCSIDGGKDWAPLKANMPTVPVHDLAIHSREGDLVAGTYGRGIWITNITPLRELNEAVLGEDVHLFQVQSRARRNDGALGGYRLSGDRELVTPNELNATAFVYYLKEEAKDKVTITVAKQDGAVVRTIDGPGKAGINRVVWNLGGFNMQLAPGETGSRPPGAPVAVAPGEYNVTLQVGERKLTQKAVVRGARNDGASGAEEHER